MPDLRSRRHAQTRADIVDAALALFTEHGFAAVTMEQVAARAGVSRSTAYRRFPTKEDIVLAIPRQWLTEFEAAVAELPATSTLAEMIEAGGLAVARHIDADREQVRTALAVADQVPALQAAGVANSRWVGRLAELAEASGHDRASAMVLAGAYMGAIDAMMAHWAANGGRASVVEATRAVHARLLPLLG